MCLGPIRPESGPMYGCCKLDTQPTSSVRSLPSGYPVVSWTYFNYSSLFFAERPLHTTQFGSLSIHSLTRDRAAQSTVAMFILTFFSQTKHNIRNVINIKTLFVSFLNFSCGYVNIWLVSHIGCPSGWSQPGTDRPARRACGRRPVCSSLNRFEGTRLRRC